MKKYAKMMLGGFKAKRFFARRVSELLAVKHGAVTRLTSSLLIKSSLTASSPNSDTSKLFSTVSGSEAVLSGSRLGSRQTVIAF